MRVDALHLKVFLHKNININKQCDLYGPVKYN